MEGDDDVCLDLAGRIESQSLVCNYVELYMLHHTYQRNNYPY